MNELIKNAETINRLLARYGVKFGIYKNGEFKEQLFPFDPIPRIIKNGEYKFLEKGLKQRVNALNCFLSDIYGEKRLVRDGVIPEEFIYSAKGFLPPCDGVTPPKNIYSHISGIDLVQSKDNNWYILEDNLRVPSGASYPMIARELQRRSAPDAFSETGVVDNRNYADMLKEVMDYVNTGGINVILSPGRYNAAFFEHSYLAEKTGAVLTTGKEIVCENDNLYYIDYNEKKQRVGAVYRRISDEYLDPMTFYEESVIGKGIIADFIHLDEGISRINVKIKGEAETEINALREAVSDKFFKERGWTTDEQGRVKEKGFPVYKAGYVKVIDNGTL